MSELKSLGEIFNNNTFFRIPDYQRGYAWSQNQLNDFWEDLINLPDKRDHYTGLLSLEQIKAEDDPKYKEEEWLKRQYTVKNVVDGQQRLTTFIIFISSFLNFWKNLPEQSENDPQRISIGDESINDVIKRFLYIVNSNSSVSQYACIFGYGDKNVDVFFKKTILGIDSVENYTETYYTHNLKKAKVFFDSSIRCFYEYYGKDEVEKVFYKALDHMKFMIHDIQAGFDIFAAFESMNNRGKKLTSFELLKSRLIYLTTLFEETTDFDESARKTLRDNIDKAWSAVYQCLGKDKKEVLSDEEFLRAYWIINYTFSKKRGEDYVSFLLNKKFIVRNIMGSRSAVEVAGYNDIDTVRVSEDYIEDIEDGREQAEENPQKSIPGKTESSKEIVDPSVINEFINGLRPFAEHWFYSFYPYNSDSSYTEEEKLWLERLNRIGIAYFRPLVALLFLKGSDSKTRCGLMETIERFIFIVFRVSGAYQSYKQSELYKMTRELYHTEKKEVGEKIKEIKNEIDDWVEKWVHARTAFDIGPFTTRLNRLYAQGDGYYRWGSLRYFLYEYEEALKEEKQGFERKVKWSDEDVKSIEHIYPQTPADGSNWALVFNGFTEKQIDFLKGSLGNMLLLSVPKNASLQNDDYVKKVERYKQGSYSETELADQYKSEWNASSILTRGIKLLDFMSKRWEIQFVDENSKKSFLGLSFMPDSNGDDQS